MDGFPAAGPRGRSGEHKSDLPTPGQIPDPTQDYRSGDSASQLPASCGTTVEEGAFAKVTLKYDANGVALAVKTPKSPLPEAWAGLQREGAMLSRFQYSGGIIECISCDIVGGLVMPWVPGGSLDKRLHTLSISEISRIIVGVLQALAYVHDKGFGHFDVKPSNVVLSSTGDPILIDFGCASPLNSAAPTVVDVNYMAPEILCHGGIVTGTADTWSTGVMLSEMLAGVLRPRRTADAVLNDFRQGNPWYDLPPLAAEADLAYGPLVGLMRLMLTEDPALRPTPAALLGPEFSDLLAPLRRLKIKAIHDAGRRVADSENLVQVLRGELANHQAELINSNQQVVALKEEAARAHGQIGALQGENDRASQLIESLEGDNSRLRENLAAAESCIRVLNRHITDGKMKEALYRELRGTAALQATRDAFGSLPNEPPTLPKGAVWKAVENGDLDSLCVLMEDGHSPEETDENGTNAIALASKKGFARAVGVLMDHGAFAGRKDRYDTSALHVASLNGHAEIVKLLLTDQSVNVHESDNALNTVVHLAVISGSSSTVKEVLNKGVGSVLRRNTRGETAYDLAARLEHEAKTALELAIRYGDDNPDKELRLALCRSFTEIKLMLERFRLGRVYPRE